MFVCHFHKYLLHIPHYYRVQSNYSALKIFSVQPDHFESSLCLSPFNGLFYVLCWFLCSGMSCDWHHTRYTLSELYLWSSLCMSMNHIFSTLNIIQLHTYIRAYVLFYLQFIHWRITKLLLLVLAVIKLFQTLVHKFSGWWVSNSSEKTSRNTITR